MSCSALKTKLVQDSRIVPLTQISYKICNRHLIRNDPHNTYTTKRADDRKRYTATIPRHRAAQQNTPIVLTPTGDCAHWSTQPRTGFWHQLLAVHHTPAFQPDRHR